MAGRGGASAEWWVFKTFARISPDPQWLRETARESGGGRVREGAYQFSVEMWRQYFLVSLGFVLVAVVAVVVAVRASVFVFLFRPHRIRMLPLSGKVSTDCSQRIQLAVIKRARGGLTLFRASQKTRRLHGRSPGASRCVHFPRLNINCRLASSFLPSSHSLPSSSCTDVDRAEKGCLWFHFSNWLRLCQCCNQTGQCPLRHFATLAASCVCNTIYSIIYYIINSIWILYYIYKI